MIMIFVVFLLLSIPEIYPADTTSVLEDENSFTLGFEKLISTNYIDRGISNNRGLIAQPDLWISYNDFRLSAWGNIVALDKDDLIKRNEVDIVLSWSKCFDNFSIEPSVNYCSFPHQHDFQPTIESSIRLAYSINEFEFYSNVWLDILECPGSTNGDFGFCYEVFSTGRLNTLLDFSSGWTNNKFNNSNYDLTKLGTAFHYFTIVLSANYYITDKIYLTPKVEYWYAFTGLLKSLSGNSLTNIGLQIGFEI